MTTEIAIMNRQGIALAADSAVTIGEERVWKTANKLFSLGPSHDIGIMMHGSAEHLGHSWETIIKLFRKKTQDKIYKTVNSCAEDFVEFVRGDIFRSDTLETVGIAGQFVDLMENIKSIMTYESKLEFRKQIIEYLKGWIEVWDDDADVKIYDTKITLKSFSESWRKDIKTLAEDVFNEVITKSVLDNLCKTMFELSRRTVESEYATGIVVCGFGSDEVCPSLSTYIFDGRHKDIFRCWKSRSSNMNDFDFGGAHVIPFGQADIIYMIMEGISLDSSMYIEEFMERILNSKSEEMIDSYVDDGDEKIVESAIQKKENKKIVSLFSDEFRNYRRSSSVNPIVNVIRSLPREEMAGMAEALVDITSLRRRIDSPLESVGGPVDVAVISKGDGFIWIKRKHYFNIELNRDFLYRKHGRGELA